MQRIGIDEVHEHVLLIAKAFDQICTRHQIPYYMIGGTMLGAIRHKGFIPWDDDMDFGVPIEYYSQLERVLINELPYPYRCCTYKNHPGVLHNYMKIEDQTTCIDDKAIDLPIEQKLGLNIDIFPLNKCKSNNLKERRIRNTAKLMGIVYNHSITHYDSIVRKGIKKVLRFVFGDNPIIMQMYIDKQLFSINNGNYLANTLGRWKDREVVPIDWYGEGVRYEFEDTSFIGLKEYEKYLTRLYGRYMSLPPKSHQVAHVENVYLR